MRNNLFFCNICHKSFKTPKSYYERHGLDSPPYEKVYICPTCSDTDFFSYNPLIEKLEVAEKALPAIMYLNKLQKDLNNIFGLGSKNDDLYEGINFIVDLVSEMFDFLEVDIQRKILKMDSEEELEKVLVYLKGVL